MGECVCLSKEDEREKVLFMTLLTNLSGKLLENVSRHRSGGNPIKEILSEKKTKKIE
jgi:hypothetical protein